MKKIRNKQSWSRLHDYFADTHHGRNLAAMYVLTQTSNILTKQFMPRFLRLLSLVCAFMAANFNASAASMVTWGVSGPVTPLSPNFFGGGSDFDDAMMTFTPFVADTLVDVTGDGIFHSHSGALTTGTLSVRVNGVWQSILSLSTTSQADFASAVPPAISFSGGIVDAISLTGDINFNQTFHFWTGMNDVFTFDNLNTNVPDNGRTFLLLCFGMMGLYASRCRLIKQTLE